MEDSLINLQGQPGLNIFSIFYHISFLVPFLILILIAVRRNYDMTRWLVIMLSGALFFLLGTRLTTFNSVEWSMLFKTGTWPVSYHKFALGGTLFALAGIQLTRRFLRFDRPVFELYAWVTPIGLALQKLGCLSAGCCYGSPTSLPWGIKYPSGSIPYLNQLASGLIDNGDPVSLSIHPTQVYQLVVYLIISVLVLSLRKRFRNPKSIVTFALMLLAGSRFLIEFMIDPDASVYGGNTVTGLKPLQLLCLAGFLVAMVLFIRYEKSYTGIQRAGSTDRRILRPVIALSAITIIFILLHNAFTSSEMIAFNIRFLVITAILVVVIFNRITIPRMRILSSLLVVLPILLLSQTVPKERLDYDKKGVISAGTSIGHYFNRVLYDEGSGSCGGPTYQDIPYENNYLSISGGYGETGRAGFQSYSWGGYLTAGYLKETNMLNSESLTRPMISATPYAEYNWRWLGIGGTLHLGYVLYTPINPFDGSTPPDKNNKFIPAFPGFSARVGPYDIFDIKIAFASGFPSPMPDNLWDLSIGSGFGNKTGSGMRFGTMGTEPGQNIYFEGHFMLKTNLGIDLRYSFGDNSYIYNDAGTNNEFRLGLRYILDR